MNVNTHRELHSLLASEWERTLREWPTIASELGDNRYNALWPEMSLDAFARRHADTRQALDRLRALPVEDLSDQDRLNLTLIRQKYEIAVEEHQYQWYLLPLTAREGIQDTSSLADSLSFERIEDYEDWIARLEAFPRFMDETLALLRAGVARDMVHARVVMQRVPLQIQRQIVGDPQLSPFFVPFKGFPDTVETSSRNKLVEQAKTAIISKIIPAFQTMLDFFHAEYLPACREAVGIWSLPRGEELYEFFARKFTTTDLTPSQIHEIGLSEVARIRAQMEILTKRLGYTGDLREFLEHLRQDRQFYFTNADALFRAYQAICARVDAGLGRLFHRLPKTWYDIRPIPMTVAPDTTTAYYRPLSADGKRPGTYFVNLYRPEVRPKYELEALSLHEAVPGHHLQIALAMEIEELPAFRRYATEGDYTAYVEGWALYAERLGDELGCYQDPYSEFGRLTYDAWRAARLVVDTGLHAFRWTREQAIEYLLANTAKTDYDVANEVDRYIAWPGQGLAYKIGEMVVRECRIRAESQLGPRFDVREFHDIVLRNGPLPLDVLRAEVDQWLSRSNPT